MVAPVAAAVLGVFWVTAGTPAGLPTNFMFEGGFLICAGLAALVIADARLIEPGWFSWSAWPPLHFIGTISYGVYLWHWPVIVYLTTARTGLPTVSLDIVRVLVTLALSTASDYLVERPIRLARPGGVVRWWGAPLAGILSVVLIVVATTPAVADPSKVVGTTHLVSASNREGRRPRSRWIRRAEADPARTVPTSVDPLRVMLLGDSVMGDAVRRDHGRAPGHPSGRGHPQDDPRLRAHDGDKLALVVPDAHWASQATGDRARGAGTSTDPRHPTPCTNRRSTPGCCEVRSAPCSPPATVWRE